MPAVTGWLTEIRLCLGLLTRFPVGMVAPPAAVEMARACRWFPLIGALVGVLSAAILYLCAVAGLPGMAAGLIAVGTSVLITGALHEDGLADVADGFWGGAERERRLSIMRDSRVGAYGVIALILAVGLRWSLVTGLMAHGIGSAVVGIVVAAAVSRLTPVLLMHGLPTARDDGMAVNAGKPDAHAVRVACGLALASLLLLPGWPQMLATAIAVPVAAWALGGLALRRIGGQTGDVLGAGQQVTEILVLLGLAAVVP